MARIRTIKPSFFTDEDIANLPFHARLAYLGLWVHADREGRLEDRPRVLKSQIFSSDLGPINAEVDMEEVLELLSRPKQNGKAFIKRYTVNNQKYIQILQFTKHQRPHHTEPPSVIPPDPDALDNASETGGEQVDNVKAPEQNRSETGGEQVDNVKAPAGIRNKEEGIRNKERTIRNKEEGIRKGEGERRVLGRKGGEKITPPYEQIIADLNSKAGTEYKYTTQKTRELINARWAEGFRLEDFQIVHTNMVNAWLHDEKMRPFLRPITLYSNKFESYRNRIAKGPLDKLSPHGRETLLAGARIADDMRRNGARNESI